MPPLGLHTTVAKQVADRLRHRALEPQRGNLYLGSTAPDIRVITRWERRRTHFFDLGDFDEQSGVEGFFAAYPALREAACLRPATVSFVAGYVTHLVMDELWINSIYRPFFGERSALGGDLRANVMDRAVQFSLDHGARIDRDMMAHILDHVVRTDLALEIDFIDADTLGRWREVIIELVESPPDWRRFRHLAGRHLRDGAAESPEGLEELLAALPDLVDETLRYLGPERVREFMERAADESENAVKEYLACA